MDRQAEAPGLVDQAGGHRRTAHRQVAQGGRQYRPPGGRRRTRGLQHLGHQDGTGRPAGGQGRQQAANIEAGTASQADLGQAGQADSGASQKGHVDAADVLQQGSQGQHRQVAVLGVSAGGQAQGFGYGLHLGNPQADALGRAGGARGEGHLGRPRRQGPDRRTGQAQAGQGAVPGEVLAVRPGQQGAQALGPVGKDEVDAGRIQDVADLVGGEIRGNRDQGAPHRLGGEIDQGPVAAVVGEQCQGPGRSLAQAPGLGLDGSPQLAVGQGATVIFEGDPVRRLGGVAGQGGQQPAHARSPAETLARSKARWPSPMSPTRTRGAWS